MRLVIAILLVALLVICPWTAIAAPPELVTLTELSQDGYNISPWVSRDGLTLYWQFTPKGEKQRWVWSAKRKGADGLFEGVKKILPGSDPTVTGDELQMILLDGQNLYSSVRKTTKEDFGRPSKISELDGVGFLACPCLSGDGLTMWAERIEKGTPTVVRCVRNSREDGWSKPELVKMPLIGSTGRTVYVDPKKGYGFCSVVELFKDKTLNSIVFLSTKDQGATFTNPVVVEVPKEVVNGSFPRYVEATRELFFVGRLDESGRSKLMVFRNFDLPSHKK
jgi:hypothetical protein